MYKDPISAHHVIDCSTLFSCSTIFSCSTGMELLRLLLGLVISLSLNYL